MVKEVPRSAGVEWEWKQAGYTWQNWAGALQMGVSLLTSWTDSDVIHGEEKDKTMGSNTHWENASACEHSGQPQDVTEKVASAPFPERRRNGVTHFLGTNALIPTSSPATYPVPFPWPFREVTEVCFCSGLWLVNPIASEPMRILLTAHLRTIPSSLV